MLILASAQFVMVLDSSVMNVAISQIVDNLDTTIQGVQTAITLYTLAMAASRRCCRYASLGGSRPSRSRKPRSVAPRQR
jgi:hypothetical protein